MADTKFSDFISNPIVTDGDQVVGLQQSGGLNARVLAVDMKTYMRSSLQNSYTAGTPGSLGQITLVSGNPLKLISTVAGFVPPSMTTLQFTAIPGKSEGEFSWSADEQRYVCYSILPSPSIKKFAFLSDIPILPPTVSINNSGLTGESIVQNGVPNGSGQMFLKGVEASGDIILTNNVGNLTLELSSNVSTTLVLQDVYDNGPISLKGDLALSSGNPLRLTSITAGFRPSVMTSAQFSAIPAKDAGLLAWSSTTLHYLAYDGTSVEEIAYLSDIPPPIPTPTLQEVYDAGTPLSKGDIDLIIDNPFRLNSISAGFIPPTMTSAQFIAIPSKGEGEMAYSTDSQRYLAHTSGGDDALAYISDIPPPIPTPTLQEVYDAGTPGSQGEISLSLGNPLKMISIDAGFIPPSMTTAQFSAIPSKDEGEMAWSSNDQRYICHLTSPLTNRELAYTTDLPAPVTLQDAFNNSALGNINLITPAKTFSIRDSAGSLLFRVDPLSIAIFKTIFLSADQVLNVSEEVTFQKQITGTNTRPGNRKFITCVAPLSAGSALKVDTGANFRLTSVKAADPDTTPIVAISTNLVSVTGQASVLSLEVFPVVCDTGCVVGQVLKKSSIADGKVTPGNPLLTTGEFCVALETVFVPTTILAARIINT